MSATLRLERDGPFARVTLARPEVRNAFNAELIEELRSTERSPEWPVYGALIINLRNIIDVMDRVAEANPRGSARLPLRVPVRRRATGG